MLTFKDIIIFIIFAIALYIYGRYCYNNGFDDALEARIAGIYKVGSDKDEDEEEQAEPTKKQVGKCNACLFEIIDEETGDLECGNIDSPYFSYLVSSQHTCDHFCKDCRRKE